MAASCGAWDATVCPFWGILLSEFVGSDQSFEAGLTFVRMSAVQAIDEHYQMPFGRRRDHNVRGREQAFTFANSSGAQLDVVLRAHNDGTALRYRFPEQDTTKRTVVAEATGFHLPSGSTGWLMPQQDAGKYGPAYEDFFQELSAGTPAPTADGWSFPALFKTTGNKWLLITEAALDDGYGGAHLASPAPDGVYRIKFPDLKEGFGVGAVEPRRRCPGHFPGGW